jgi:hypothetical protein
MKHIILAFGLCAYIIFCEGCKKDNTEENKAKENIDISTSIAGTWELRQAQSGMTPTINYSSGNGNILKFTATDYRFYSNGQFIKSGKYFIIKDTSVLASECMVIPPDQYVTRIVYDSNRTESKKIEQTSNNKLIFLTGCFAYDSGVYIEYERQ